jgi:hypothetical protein
MRRVFTCVSMALLLAGCPESPGPEGPGGEGPGAGGPGGPPPGGPGAGGPEGRPDNAHFDVAEGEGVTLSGTMSYDGEQAGSIRLDFLVIDAGGTAPKLMHAESLNEMGAWSLDVPKDFGELIVVGFIDADADGPSPTDPAATVTLDVAGENMPDIELKLVDDPDLGTLTPGVHGGPGADGEAPPEGGPDGAPPDGAPPEGEPGEPTAPGEGLPPVDGADAPEGDAPEAPPAE